MNEAVSTMYLEHFTQKVVWHIAAMREQEWILKARRAVEYARTQDRFIIKAIINGELPILLKYRYYAGFDEERKALDGIEHLFAEWLGRE
jgi:hypothetical protein